MASVVWFATILSACIVEDGDKACSKNQVLVEGEGTTYCACAPGFIIDVTTGLDCKACGENEETVAGACVCKTGYTRPSEGAACGMSSLGAACVDSTGCSGAFPACVTDDGAGYCTSEGCSSSADCERGFVCEQDAGKAVCKKVPTGYGMSCTTSADCAGSEATYCDSFQSKSCLVTCSKTSPCPGDWSCCDIAIAQVVLCVEPAGLMDGACPAGGTLVKP